jgi:hypothetical protein
VRSAAKYGSILVRGRRRPVARITPASEEPAVNRFATWTLKKFAALLDPPVPVTIPVAEPNPCRSTSALIARVYLNEPGRGPARGPDVDHLAREVVSVVVP